MFFENNFHTSVRFESSYSEDVNEDGIPIRKVHIRNLHHSVSYKALKDIFERFGRVEQCKVHYNDHGKPIYAFVTFDSVCNAKKALTTPLYYRRLKLKVSPADTWHQPRVDNGQNGAYNYRRRNANRNEDVSPQPSGSQAKDEETDDAVLDTSSDEYNILDMLNHDCIMKIFSYLPLRDLIASERVSKKWQSLVLDKLQCTRIFKTSSWARETSPLTTNTLRTLLVKFGRSLRKLHLDYQWSVLNERTPQIISKFCPNLTEALLTGIAAKTWRPMLQNCVDLKSLSFVFCQDILDNNFIHIKSHLEELSITNTHQLNGHLLKFLDGESLKKLVLNKCHILDGGMLMQHFPNFVNLKKLSLDYSSITVSRHLSEILRLVPGLTEFSNCNVTHSQMTCLEAIGELNELRVLLLSRNSSVNDDVLKRIVKGCPNLTTLDVSARRSQTAITDDGISQLWKLPNLEVLGISDIGVSDKAFKHVGVNDNGAKLKTLACRHNDELTNASFIKVVQMCPEITKIDAYGCYKVNEEFVKSASETVMLHPNRTEKLLLHVAHIDMLNDLSQEALKQINCPLLKLETTEDFCDPLLHSYKMCCNYNNLLDSDDDGDEDEDDGDEYDALSDILYYGEFAGEDDWSPDDFDDDDDEDDDDRNHLYPSLDAFYKAVFVLNGN